MLFVIASALCAMSQTLFQLIVFRALQGVGGGGLMSMAQAAIADVVAPRERGRYQGYMAGTWGVASITGPVLGGWMTDHLTWHSIFWINLPVGAAAYILSSRALKLLPVRSREARIDYVGAALLTLLITLSLLVMSWGGIEYPWEFGADPRHDRRLRRPAAGAGLAGTPGAGADAAAAAVRQLGVQLGGADRLCWRPAALFGATFLLPLFFQLIRGQDASASGMMIAPFLAFNACGAYVSGRVSRWLGRSKGIVLAGLGVSVAGFVLMAISVSSNSVVLELLVMAVVGLGTGVCMPGSMMIAQNAVERRDLGAATASLLFLRSMGSAFGSTLVGAILASRFADGLAAAGITTQIDLGALRSGGAGGQLADPAVRAVAHGALAGGFQMAFALCAILVGIAFLVCARMRDLPLQSSR